MGTRFGIESTYEFEFINYDSEGIRHSFINAGDLIQFVYSEQIGGELPTYRLDFASKRDDSLVEYSEKKPFKIVVYNEGKDQVFSAWLIPTKIKREKIGDDKYITNSWGMLVANGYYHIPKKYITDKQSSKKTVEETVKEYDFTFNSDLDDKDEMYWIRPNISAKRFVDDVVKRAFVPDSFPVIGIECHNGERIFNMLNYHKLKDREATKVNPDDGLLVNNWQLLEEPGLLNDFYGYEREVSLYKLEEGIREDHSYTHKPSLSNVGEVPVLNRKKSADVEIYCENVHDTWDEAKLRALAGWCIFGNKSIVLNLTKQIFHPMRIFDIIEFQEFKIPHGKLGGYSQYLGGKYVITKKLFYLNNQTFKTTLIVSKEFLNE